MIGPRSGPMLRQAVSALAPPSNVHVWLACGLTDMRKGFDGLASLAQNHLGKDPFSGQLFVFRGRRGSHAT
jgi:transposase